MSVVLVIHQENIVKNSAQNPKYKAIGIELGKRKEGKSKA